MRVKAGPDPAWRHVSTSRPDISGTLLPDLSLLRHRVCCREHHAGTDCKNYLLHGCPPDVLTMHAIAKAAARQSFPRLCGTAIVWSAAHCKLALTFASSHCDSGHNICDW